MKRIIALLMVALVMVAAVVVMTASAFAAQCPGNPLCENPGGQPHGANQTFQNPSQNR